MIGESPIAPKPLLGNGFGGAAGTGEWGGGECRSECGGVGTKIALGGKQTGGTAAKGSSYPMDCTAPRTIRQGRDGN